MKITILNGNPDPVRYALDNYLTKLSVLLNNDQHDRHYFYLEENGYPPMRRLLGMLGKDSG